MTIDLRYRILKILYNARGEMINLRPVFQPEIEAGFLKRITLADALRGLATKKHIIYQDTVSLNVSRGGVYPDEIPLYAKIRDEGIEEYIRLTNLYYPKQNEPTISI